jgi:hypothetical protein
MARESDDPITAAIIATNKEIAGDAWGNEETDALDASGDRSLEDLGEGLEGQHEADGEVEGEEAGDELDTNAKVVETEPEPVAAKPGDKQVVEPTRTEPEGRVPPARYREVSERARAAETERDTLKAALEKRDADSKAQLDLVMRELAALKTAPREQPRQVEPPKAEVVPDIFENPTAFVEHMQKGFQKELSNRDAQIANMRIESSMSIAHKFHKDTFEKAWTAVNALNPADPDARSTVQRIMASPDPGEALVSWHKRSQTLAEVGDDPAAYRDRVAKETREALLKDPEFRKQLFAEARADAANGENGGPRTTTRLPRSLNGAQGSNVGVDRTGADTFDGSPQSIADAAWR